MKAYGFIHTHSEYSLKDAPLKLADIVKEAKKMGATAIALTDHGTAAGWIEFYDLCKNEGIKPILGVEAYIRSETNSRTHLILLAKNYTGYKEISQAISDSNENIERIADMDIPIMTKEILQKYLHGDNVIVTSACVSGVLSEILLSRKKIQEQVDSIKKKMDDYYSPYDTGYLKNKELVSSLDTEIAELTAKKEKLEIIAKRNFREQKKSLSIYKKEDLSLYEERKKQLEKEEQETKEAKKSVSEINEHTWDAGKVTKAATCTQAGEKTYTCSVCGATKKEIIKKTEHEWAPRTETKVSGKDVVTTTKKTYDQCSVCKSVRNMKTVNSVRIKTPSVTLKAGKKSFTAKTKKLSGINGYQIRYSVKKNMKKSKTVTTKKTSKTVKKLISKKKYYVQVRAYKTVNGKKVFSSWSKVKNITTKK